MIYYIQIMPLNNLSLLLTLLLPFSYYIYQAKYWYLPDRIRFCDFLLRTVTIIFAAILLIKLSQTVQQQDRALSELALLHLAPLVLALLAISHGKKAERRGATEDLGEVRVAAAKERKPGTIEKIGWQDLIVNDDLKEELNSVVNLLRDPKTAGQYGIAVPKGILLSGPPGTGKTSIAKVMANTAGLSFFVLRADDVVSKWVGESEKNLTSLFEQAAASAPAVLFIDEIDSLGKKRSGGDSSHSDNLVNHLLQLIDGVIKVEGLYIIAATNRPDLVDQALKRAGRLNRVIEIALPDRESRRKLFELYLSKLKVADDVDIDILAEVTEGNSPADICEICNQAGLQAYRRESASGNKSRNFVIQSVDLEASLDLFGAEQDDDEGGLDQKKSSEIMPLNQQIEQLSWDDLIIDPEAKEELMSVIELLRDPAAAQNYGIEVPKGILLNGPPGTGKTTIAKVIANTAGLAFFVLQMDEVVSKWVGDSEKNLTRLFKAALRHSPSVIFIDEVDSIAKNRSDGNPQHSDNLLNHLLQLIDGVVKRQGIYVIAATNRGDLVDPALKRGGRLNKVIEIPLPGYQARKDLFSLYLARLKLAEGIDISALAKATEGKSGADIRAICNQAGLNAFRRESARGNREYAVRAIDVEKALVGFVESE